MRERAMDLTINDEGHARQIVKDALEDTDFDARNEKIFGNVESEHNFLRTISSNISNKSVVEWDEKILSIYAYQTLARMAKKAKGHWIRQPDWLQHAVDDLFRLIEGAGRARINNKYYEPLEPTRRYLIGVVLRLFPYNDRLGASIWNEPPNYCEACEKPVLRAKGFSRHKIVPRWGDPLLILEERLGIRRFLTTNYDHELFRLFKDQGFQTNEQPTAGQASSVGHSHPTDRDCKSTEGSDEEKRPGHAIAHPFRITVFTNDKAGDLIAFSAQDRSRSGQAVHLHGRAERSRGSIVVSEIDYQHQYLSADPSRDLVDQAIKLAFGANPVLFVGSNMGEDDILRPLRQFMSTPSRIGDRVCVALIPGKYDFRYCIEEKIDLLGRFGVYTIYFGNASVAYRNQRDLISQADRDARDYTHAFWLPWALEIIKGLLGILEELAPKDGLAVSIDISDKISELNNLIIGRNSSQGDGKLIWAMNSNSKDPLDNFTDLKDGDKKSKLVAPTMLEGIEVDEGGINLELEVNLINSALGFVRENDDNKSRELSVLTAVGRAALAYRAALNGAADAMLTTFTCASDPSAMGLG